MDRQVSLHTWYFAGRPCILCRQVYSGIWIFTLYFKWILQPTFSAMGNGQKSNLDVSPWLPEMLLEFLCWIRCPSTTTVLPTRIYYHAGTCQLVQVGSSCRANVSLSSKALLSISKGKGWSTVVILFSVCARGEIATHIYSMCASRSLGSNLILLLSQSSPESFSCLWTPIATKLSDAFVNTYRSGHH